MTDVDTTNEQMSIGTVPHIHHNHHSPDGYAPFRSLNILDPPSHLPARRRHLIERLKHRYELLH